MKKESRMRIILITAVITAAVTSVATFIGCNVMFLMGDSSLFGKMRAISSVAKNYYLYDYDYDAFVDGAARGAVEALDDPYTEYYSKQEYKDFMDSMNGDFVGIGAYVHVNPDTNEIVITQPMPGGAAEEAGLLAGDVIYAIDGEIYTGEQLEEAVAAMRGVAEGSPEEVEVNVTIKRGEELKDYTLTRKRIHTKTVSSKLMDDGIGYIKIDSFNTSDEGEKDTFAEFSEAVEELKGNNAEKLIIDLRNNGGGDADVVSNIADMLLPEGTIMYTEDKTGYKDYRKSDENELNMPIALIVNENSASASELLAGALKDYDKAELVGTTTYGKGVVQSIVPFKDGSGMKVTISSYFTPDGYCVQDKGIEPDYVVDLPEELKMKPVSDLTYEEDVQLQKAVEVLK